MIFAIFVVCASVCVRNSETMKNGTIKNGKLSNIINNNNNEIGFDEQEIDEEEQQQYSGNPFVHRLEDGGLFDHIKVRKKTEKHQMAE